jgi:D-methionine transport system ATP-binding protein
VTHIPAPPIHIEFAGISKAYPNGVQALQDIDLTIRQGEIFGIIGRSGAGKSTLLRLFNRLESADSGEMFIHGESTVRYSTRQLRDLRRRVAMIFQHFNLMATKTVAQNIALPLKMAGIPAGERQRRVTEMLELVGLSALRDSYPPAFPAARNSEPASPGRWSLNRKFCCAMRQPRRWIRKTPCRC